jgi:hypothetical protein
MNTLNASTGFSPFQLCLSRSPRIIPPIVLDPSPPVETVMVNDIIERIQIDVEEEKDNLLQAKVFQAHYSNEHHTPKLKYHINGMNTKARVNTELLSSFLQLYFRHTKLS